MTCPYCQRQLVLIDCPYGKAYQCGTCKSIALSWSVFYKNVHESDIKGLWRKILSSPKSSIPCPECSQMMASVQHSTTFGSIEYFVCIISGYLWILPDQFTQLERIIPPIKKNNDELAPEVREKIAIAFVEEHIRLEKEFEDDSKKVADAILNLPGVLPGNPQSKLRLFLYLMDLLYKKFGMRT